MGDTTISWADKTSNPITGCQMGCHYCYAADIANRFWGDRPFTDVQFHPERLEEIFKWRKPQRVFVNSMGDLFGPAVKDEWLDRIFAAMMLNPKHTFQILTKYPERMSRYCNSLDLRRLMSAGGDWKLPDYAYHIKLPLPNVHLGVTVENQKAADDRIPHLLQTIAAVRFLSCEPLLGPINLERIDWRPDVILRALSGIALFPFGGQDYQKINWVIVGGMSGPKAIATPIEHIETIVEQCKSASIPVFVKQLGSKPTLNGKPYMAIGKGEMMSEWPKHLQIREFPK